MKDGTSRAEVVGNAPPVGIGPLPADMRWGRPVHWAGCSCTAVLTLVGNDLVTAPRVTDSLQGLEEMLSRH